MTIQNTLSATLTMFAAAMMFQACSESNKNTGTENRTMQVSVARPVCDSVTVHKEYPGYISADNAVKVVARVNGQMTSKLYDSGDYVKKGQVLFTIEDTQYRDAVQRAKSDLETALATNKYATAQYNAMKKALESDAVAQLDVTQAESSMNESLASIESARAALRTAETNLSYCTVTAPISGHVSSCNFSVGDYLSGAAAPVELTTIYDDAIVKAVFSVEEKEYISMKRNADSTDFDNVPLSFAQPLPHAYSGKLCYVSPAVDKSTGTLTLNLLIENKDGELKDGMFTTISMPAQTVTDAILVNDASISTDQLGKYVYTVNDSDKIVYTPIKTGETVSDTMRIVTDGLTLDSRYVTKALLKVRDGMTVKPVVEN